MNFPGIPVSHSPTKSSANAIRIPINNRGARYGEDYPSAGTAPGTGGEG